LFAFCQAPLNFGRKWLSEIQWCRNTDSDTAPLAGTRNPLIASNRIPVDQLTESDGITGGRCWEGVDDEWCASPST
jgi:hypothetical protein